MFLILKESIENAFNKQINWELYSAYMYLSMSAYFESISMSGFASWMRAQAQEEQFHAMKFFDHIIARGGKVELMEIKKPPSAWSSPVSVFEETYKHEKKVTGLINDLVALAINEDDYASRNMLQWFVDEQVEEEENASSILHRIKALGSEESGLYLLDQELGKRAFTASESKEK